MGDLVLRRDLLRRGYSEDDVRRAVRHHELRTLRPGAYLEPDDPRWRDAAARHRALIEATLGQLARPAPSSAASRPPSCTACRSDAALHADLVDLAALRTALRDADGRHGVARARAVLAFADGAAESPGESRSRVRMDLRGVAPPVLRHTVLDATGRYVERVDFWWPRTGTVGEFDGLEKYGRSLRPGGSIADAVVREKLREDALRAQPGVQRVVRWTFKRPRRLRRRRAPPALADRGV